VLRGDFIVLFLGLLPILELGPAPLLGHQFLVLPAPPLVLSMIILVLDLFFEEVINEGVDELLVLASPADVFEDLFFPDEEEAEVFGEVGVARVGGVMLHAREDVAYLLDDSPLIFLIELVEVLDHFIVVVFDSDFEEGADAFPELFVLVDVLDVDEVAVAGLEEVLVLVGAVGELLGLSLHPLPLLSEAVLPQRLPIPPLEAGVAGGVDAVLLEGLPLEQTLIVVLQHLHQLVQIPPEVKFQILLRHLLPLGPLPVAVVVLLALGRSLDLDLALALAQLVRTRLLLLLLQLLPLLGTFLNYLPHLTKLNLLLLSLLWGRRRLGVVLELFFIFIELGLFILSLISEVMCL